MSDLIGVKTFCMFCQKDDLLYIPISGYLDWKRGDLIQFALPDLSDGQREQLLSGSHEKCFDSYFSSDV